MMNSGAPAGGNTCNFQAPKSEEKKKKTELMVALQCGAY
jgi:hypothetical protein